MKKPEANCIWLFDKERGQQISSEGQDICCRFL